MANTKLYLDLRGKAKDGKGSILILLYHNFSTTSISTGIRISSEDWDKESQCVINIPGADAINVSLQEKKNKIDKSIAILSMDSDFYGMSASELKKQITVDKPKRKSGHPISLMFDEYMYGGNLKHNTKEIYRNTLKRIIAFAEKDINIEDINLKWVRSFDAWLSETQCINGRSIYLRAFRAVCNYARHIGVMHQYPFDMFQIKQEPTQKRSVSVEKLREFMVYPTTKENEVYRDYFFLMFYLIGINTKDLLLAQKSQIVNGRLEYIREKTGKKYSVKIEPEAEELISKYNGKGDYLLDAMDHCKLYRSFQHAINDGIKAIGEQVEYEVLDENDLFGSKKVTRIDPVIPGISTYYARHCWATFAYEKGVPIDVISQAMGHSFGNRTTLIYVKFDQKKVDEANRKVLDFFLGKL